MDTGWMVGMAGPELARDVVEEPAEQARRGGWDRELVRTDFRKNMNSAVF